MLMHYEHGQLKWVPYPRQLRIRYLYTFATFVDTYRIHRSRVGFYESKKLHITISESHVDHILGPYPLYKSRKGCVLNAIKSCIA